MASIANSFALLHGAENAVASANKKKKAKPKAPAVSPAPPSAAASGAPGSSQPASVPQSLPTSDLVVAAVERDAREHKTVSDKARLWRDWIRQATDKSAKAPRYQSPSGDLLDFKQVLTSSKALEISIEGCLTTGVPHERDAGLSSLLSAVLPAGRAAASGGALGSALGRLAQLVADDAPDTLGAAQRAVHHVVASLKALSDETDSDASASDGAGQTGLQKVLALEQQALKQHAVLVKLGQANSGVVSKEQTNLARQIYRLHEEKLDLLAASDGKLGAAAPSTSNGARDGALEASVRSLDELKAVIGNHLKALESAPRGKVSADSAKQTLAAYRREEGLLDQQAAEVAAQIRALDSQLRSLRNQAAEIDDKKAQIQQRQRMVLDAQQQGGRAGQGQLGASHYQDELAVAQALQEILDPSRSKSAAGQGAAAGPDAADLSEAASSDYINNAQRYLSLTLASLTSLPAKVAFCKHRLSQALKLVALGAPAGAGQKEDAEKLLAETLRGAEEVLTAGVQVVGDVQRRYPAIMRLTPPGQQAAVSLQLQAVEGMVAQLRSAYDGVLVASTATAPPPEPQLPRGGGGGAGRGAGRGGHGGGGYGATAPVEAAPAPAAAAVPAVVAHPATALPAHFSYLGLDDEAPPPPHIANGGAPPAPIAAAVAAPAAPPPAAEPVAAAAAPTRPAGPPPRTWGKVSTAAATEEVEEGERGLTPAEAFRSAAPDVAESSSKPASARRNRRKA